MTIFRFFKMAAAAIWNFYIFEILMLGTLKRIELRQRAKFGRNWSNSGQDTWRFFDFPRWRPPDLGFSKF